MQKIPERLPKSILGLKTMIDYINKFYNTKDLTILEIGSWTGLSMQLFAEHFKTVICVDPWSATGEINTLYNMRDVEKIFDSRIKSNVIKYKAKSQDVIIKEHYDILYIDGLHNYESVKGDIIKHKSSSLKFIAGHDYSNKFPGVIKAVNELIGKPDYLFSDTSFIKAVKNGK